MPRPYAGTGSLSPTFVPARSVDLAVKPACAITLDTRLPTGPSGPLSASVTLWEATAPVKLPARHCPRQGSLVRVRHQMGTERYFTGRLHTHWRACFAVSPPMLHNPHLMPIPRYSKGPGGLFRPSALNEHLYSYCNFAELLVETAGEVVTPFVQVGTYPTRNFATLGWL